MKTGTIVAVVLGVAGAAGVGYVLYRRNQAGKLLQATQDQQAIATGSQIINSGQAISPGPSPYEGKGFRLPDGRIFIVKDGVLRHVVGWSGWDKTGWPSRRYEDLVAAGVIKQVNQLPAINVGPQLNGFLIRR